MNTRTFTIAAFAASLLVPLQPVSAGSGCYVDPVQEYAWGGKVVSAVFLRTNACTDSTSSILLTLPQNAAVDIVAETDGWYYVQYNGSRGWVGSQFLSVMSQASTGNNWSSYQDFMQAFPSMKATTPAPQPPTTVTADPALAARLLGYILLDVQSHGEAWYLNPTDSRRYYMKDGATAYQMMRSFGLGVSEADYTRLENGDQTLLNRLRGRIILRVQQHGEAYYIHPKTLAVHYLKDGPAAYEVMRFNSLGITSSDLLRLTTNEVPVI